MKFNTITNRYILKEMVAPFSINVLVFSFLFLMAKMIDITNWIVNHNLSLFSVFIFILYTMPWFLTFLRLSGDNEIVALKSCGLSVYGLLPPVLLFSFLGFLLTIFMTLYGVPWGKMSLGEMALKIAASNVDIGLKERTFNDSFKDVMLYVKTAEYRHYGGCAGGQIVQRTR